MKIGIISTVNPSDRKSSSGTIFSISESLKRVGYEVVWIPVKINLTFKICSKLYRFYSKLTGKNILFNHSLIGAKLMSKTIKIFDYDNVDICLAPFSSPALYNYEAKKPLIYLSDATFDVMLDYYDSFSNIPSKYINEGNLIEQKALDISDVVVVSADWAKQSAINDYGLPENKIQVIEFGANIDEEDIKLKKTKNPETLNMLFLGVEWKRKGGDIAVEACRYINSRGIKSNLYIVGIKKLDPDVASLNFVKNIGFLNKNNREEYQKLIDIFQICDCLLLPTIAECSGIAFVESSAYGLPIFSHITGGVSNYVSDGVNGYLLKLGSTGIDFGKKIVLCYSNGEIDKMSSTSQQLYISKLNWNVWGDKMKSIIENLY